MLEVSARQADVNSNTKSNESSYGTTVFFVARDYYPHTFTPEKRINLCDLVSKLRAHSLMPFPLNAKGTPPQAQLQLLVFGTHAVGIRTKDAHNKVIKYSTRESGHDQKKTLTPAFAPMSSLAVNRCFYRRCSKYTHTHTHTHAQRNERNSIKTQKKKKNDDGLSRWITSDVR